MARSARIMIRKLDIGRTPEQPSTTVRGRVDKIIPSRNQKKSGRAQVAIDEASHPNRNFRIENSPTDEHGDEVKLKKGARVDVIVAAKGTTSNSTIMEGS